MERNIPAHSVLERNIPAYSVLVHAKLKKLLLLRNLSEGFDSSFPFQVVEAELLQTAASTSSSSSHRQRPCRHAQAFLAFKLCELVALVLLRFCLLFDLLLLCLLAPS